VSIYHKHQITARDQGQPWHPDAPDWPEEPGLCRAELEELCISQELEKEEKTCFALGLNSRTARYILGKGGEFEPVSEHAEVAPDDTLAPITPKVARKKSSSGVFCPDRSSSRNDVFKGSWLFDDGQDGVWETFAKTPGAVFTKADTDLADHTEDYVINLCDCISKCAPAGDILARRIFNRYPNADVYLQRKMGASPSIPGTSSIQGAAINIFCRLVPGPPLPSAKDLQLSPYAEDLLSLQMPGESLADDWADSANLRLIWFRQALADVAEQLSALRSGEDQIFLGVPNTIGELEDMGPQFLAAVYGLAAEHKWLKISIYTP